ncbi:WD repeat-containing protein 6 isoform X2 [Leptopilina boulardi]|uniref:WD repeat-containing protein 6 isoform X2 n=1 Tax=Leptopilina boulardi TaxID=63433 RepID=UPI0021F568FF|nr:WD repeat-containing protein 6 isoform X2 [Leptopilina boulardi]
MHSTYSKTDVLAIRYVDDFICLGLGTILYIINKSNYKVETKLNVLYPHKIHGIKIAPGNKLIIFGGKSLRICKLIITGNQIKIENVSDIYCFTDWIIAVEFFRTEDEIKLIILFAHNYLYICDLLNEQHRIIWCEEKCILYGGSIFPKNCENAVVFSGTVFQEILIWQVNINDCNDIRILHRLKGHNGVVFSVFYDPLTNIMCSTSDDRTVRLWSIYDEMGNINSSNVEWSNVQVNLLATMYGHTARVWRAIIKQSTVVSIGEDSQICLWSINGKFLNKIQAHNGSPIWCLDISTDDRRMITGAADGSVYVWPFPFINEEKKNCTLGSEINKTPKFTCFLSDGTILVVRDDGEINFFNSITHCLTKSFSVSNLSSYLVIQLSPDRKRICFASKDGFISIYEINNEQELTHQINEKIMDSKIFSMQWLSNESLLLCGSLGRLIIVDVKSDGKVKILYEYILPESRERWTTAAILYENLIICGDRIGSVFVFKKSPNDKDFQKPLQTFYKIHGKLGIQSCSIRANKLITAGRDGHLRFYEIRNENDEYFLELECSKNMPMDWISRIFELQDDQFVFGFSEIDFIVYSISLRRILVRIPCGGGHRSWDCVIDENILKFLFIKDKQIHLRVSPFQKLALCPVVEGYHSKEILCLEKIKTLRNSFIFISGGEDCTLRVSRGIQLMPNKGIEDFQTLNIINGHISSVKCLAILNVENTESCCKNLIFSGGGRAQLKVWQLSIKLENGEFLKENLSCKFVNSFMLRGTDKERKKLSKTLKNNYDVDPETRFMDINVHSLLDVSNSILLFVACSDGYLRVLSWSADSKFKVENTLKYNRCILKVHSFMNKNNLIVLTMATDGIVNFWEFSYLLPNSNRKEMNTPFTQWKIHQSGINSFDIKQINSHEYLFSTGGDDNLISLILFQINLLENGDLSAKILMNNNSFDCHYTQITGIKFFQENKLCSVGTDQKVIIHRYSMENDALLLLKENEIITCVSDVQGITLSECNDKKFLFQRWQYIYMYIWKRI